MSKLSHLSAFRPGRKLALVIVEIPGGVGVAQRRTSYRAREVLAHGAGYAHALADRWGVAYKETTFAEWSEAICGASNLPPHQRALLIRMRLLDDGLDPEMIEKLDGHALDACGIAMWAAATRRIEAATIGEKT